MPSLESYRNKRFWTGLVLGGLLFLTSCFIIGVYILYKPVPPNSNEQVTQSTVFYILTFLFLILFIASIVSLSFFIYYFVKTIMKGNRVKAGIAAAASAAGITAAAAAVPGLLGGGQATSIFSAPPPPPDYSTFPQYPYNNNNIEAGGSSKPEVSPSLWVQDSKGNGRVIFKKGEQIKTGIPEVDSINQQIYAYVKVLKENLEIITYNFKYLGKEDLINFRISNFPLIIAKEGDIKIYILAVRFSRNYQNFIFLQSSNRGNRLLIYQQNRQDHTSIAIDAVSEDYLPLYGDNMKGIKDYLIAFYKNLTKIYPLYIPLYNSITRMLESASLNV